MRRRLVLSLRLGTAAAAMYPARAASGSRPAPSAPGTYSKHKKPIRQGLPSYKVCTPSILQGILQGLPSHKASCTPPILQGIPLPPHKEPCKASYPTRYSAGLQSNASTYSLAMQNATLESEWVLKTASRQLSSQPFPPSRTSSCSPCMPPCHSACVCVASTCA